MRPGAASAVAAILYLWIAGVLMGAVVTGLMMIADRAGDSNVRFAGMAVIATMVLIGIIVFVLGSALHPLPPFVKWLPLFTIPGAIGAGSLLKDQRIAVLILISHLTALVAYGFVRQQRAKREAIRSGVGSV